jgi:FolB domain-containing protein
MNKSKILKLRQEKIETKQSIIIKNFITKSIFGYYENEKITPQRLKFNLKISTVKLNINDKKIEDLVDYDDVIKVIKKILKNKINFLETLCEEICSEIFKDSRVTKIYIKVEKLDISNECESVGYETTKSKHLK